MTTTNNPYNNERQPEDAERKKKAFIYAQLLERVSDLAGVSVRDVSKDSDIIGDLNFDSLQIYELVVDLEGDFDIRLSDDELEKVNTVRDIVNLIYTLTQSKND